MATQVRGHKAYTVGWVCALPKEQTAATAMLDERHPNLPKPPNDPNTYTLGSIGDHNIVIACLPKGKVGTVSAASVAAHMIHAFPGIRFGLMVGIGGGVPRHVRLGDVVVSVPTDQHPGVVQWDMGKAEQGGSFRRTGALNNPPTLLLTALARLETDHELHGTKIPQYMEELKERYPRMAAQYLKLDDLQDILFKAGYDHVDQQHQDSVEDEEIWEESESEAGDDCRHCDKAQVVRRKPRDMRVHYGLIASGNQVIKDAQARDQLSVDLGRKVLCIEMEAAGLMDGFPCIVIRGICDYADSHKNKAWQKHAAAVAAAFAKELLGYVVADEVCGAEPANALLGIISQDVATIREHTTRKTQLLNNKEDMEIIDWISTINYGAQQTDTLKRWHPKTNQWFLCSAEYQRWLQTHGRTLYCPGIPGAGKTILASAIINDIGHRFSTDSNVALAHVYFSFSRHAEQTVELVLASLLTQLLRGQSFLPDHVRSISETHQKKGTHLTHSELLTSLSRVIPEYDRVFIVLDALDECTSQNRVKFLSDMHDLQIKMNINILATSRPHEEIVYLLMDENTTIMPIVPCSEDMSIMLQSVIRTFDKEIYDDEFREHVVSKIIKVADGMFLLANLHSNSLAALPTKGDILDALDKLDKGSDPLDAVYELSMQRIEGQGSGLAQLAKKIILWIVHARRIMSSAEITHALAIRPNTKAIDTNYCPSIRTIKSICAGLVTIDEESDAVRLVHYTAQEYFEKTSGKWFVDAHDHITQICATYLSFDAFEGYCHSFEGFKERCIEFPFYHYASKEWGHHAQLAKSEEHVVDFLRKQRHVQASIQALETSELRLRHWKHDQDSLGTMNGLHLASRFGLVIAIKALLADYDANVGDAYGQTPLSWAASNGHGAVVEFLLGTKEAGIDLPDYLGQTPLLKAASNGHANVVRLLLSTGKVDPDKPDYRGRTALSWAAWAGSEAVVNLLLSDEKVDLNFPDCHGCTPLMWAVVSRDRTTEKRLLFADKAQTARLDHNGRALLSWAAEYGDDYVVEVLLDINAIDVNLQDNHGRTPLSWAASNGHDSVVIMLLSTGKVDINIPDENGRTPLSLAAGYGYEVVIEVLLGTEAIDVDLPDDNGQTPLYWASLSGNDHIALMLLFTGKVDVNLTDQNGRTPLSLAAEYGYEAVIEVLLGTEAIYVDLPDNRGRTPLSWAASNGHIYVMRMLLLTGKADTTFPDKSGRTPLSWAIEKGFGLAVNVLLDTSESFDVLSEFLD
ncbi:hypothetical protein PFICI_04631 [Pestalotiopsis fici W106-1]|uniref:Uncharacterized protein n=1 Tax=Pestalotiopsis fici (strain W106-1 / CGMCC3.15140) TaxID=1229662 RepID=W3X9M8_PESFW|nr:uncharacterized protein PFICI_04631 [Pestalotiopsis fici W106-1]ETS82755.1 hypothetical protein PFICI_04631 [Pestalotiopsis fici W106-1]